MSLEEDGKPRRLYYINSLLTKFNPSLFRNLSAGEVTAEVTKLRAELMSISDEELIEPLDAYEVVPALEEIAKRASAFVATHCDRRAHHMMCTIIANWKTRNVWLEKHAYS